MDIGDNLKKLMGITPEKEQKINDIMSGNAPPVDTNVLKDKATSMAMDLNPIGGAIGVIKEIPDFLGKLQSWGAKATDILDIHSGAVTSQGYDLDKVYSNMEKRIQELKGKAVQYKMEGANSPSYLKNMYDDFVKEYSDRATNLEIVKEKTKKIYSDPVKSPVEPFGMAKTTDLGDIIVTRSAKDPSKFQMTFFSGKRGQSDIVRDMQFDTKEEAIKAFENQ